MEVVPIGVAVSPHTEPSHTPPQADPDGPEVRIEVEEPYRAGLAGLRRGDPVVVVMWFDRAHRDRLVQVSRTHPEWGERGVFALRSPHRPNPIGISTVPIASIDETGLTVVGLDCLDGTPIIDLKPG